MKAHVDLLKILTTKQYRLMKDMISKPSSKNKYRAERMKISSSSLSRIISELVKKGLVKKHCIGIYSVSDNVEEN